MRETATGRRLLEEGRAEGRVTGRRRHILLVLEARLGSVPAWVAARLEAEHDPGPLEGLLMAAANADATTDLEALFVRASTPER